MTKAGILKMIGALAGVIAIIVVIVQVSQYLERLSGRISQLEEQARSLPPIAAMTDRLNDRVSQLEEQMRSLDVSSGSVVEASVRLDGRISQLEEKMRSLTASSAATVAAINEVIRKPAVTVNPILQKCVELAEEANTGQRQSGMGFSSGPEVKKDALTSMEKLGCNSVGH